MDAFLAPPRYVGRAAQRPLPNRFERVHLAPEPLEPGLDESRGDNDKVASPGAAAARIPTQFFPDLSRTIIRENNSPDVPFRYSVNPYRGCEHGCAYCYARPTHETLGLDAALDFESKIVVKHDAPKLLRAELARSSWRCEPIVMSGVTDCYQPAERIFRLTRQCLEVMLEARQPVGIITKNVLVLGDLDLIGELARRRLIHVNISLTTLDADLARRMEPRTASPAARLRTIDQLTAAGVPVRAMVAPVIPGLNDSELPAILRAASEAGAVGAGFVLLRLPWTVRPVFRRWLDRAFPEKRDRVLALIRQTRGGRDSDANFGTRMKGAGPYAEGIARTFAVFSRKYGLDRPLPELDVTQFRPPRDAGGQLPLF